MKAGHKAFDLSNHRFRVLKVMAILEETTKRMQEPMVFLLKKELGNSSFFILVACLLSLRTRDSVTYPVCKKLFSKAKNPHELLAISISDLRKILYPLGFFNKKADLLHNISLILINRFGGIVPNTREELLSIKGIGRKTANLVLSEAYDIPAICVDTHVHRLANDLGLVSTRTTEQTEKALQDIVPKNQWSRVNYLFVMYGQQVSRKFQVQIINDQIKKCTV